jgi:hypothetical protein
MFLLLAALGLLLAACGGSSAAPPAASDAADAPPDTQETTPDAASEATDEPDVSSGSDEAAADAAAADAAAAGAATEDASDSQPTLPPAEPPAGAANEFDTDFSQRSVSFDEILSGGPPRDGIPPIDDPQFVSVDEAAEWLEPVEPVIRVVQNGEARAYPIQILTWHEIVNDTVGDVPVVVTFCPLCNTGIAFKRTVDEQVLDFGTTGRLRRSNLIMYDRQTESWWQQATGEAIIGEMTGEQLEFVLAEMIAWEDFQAANPDGLVLSRNTGFDRPYGNNPYQGYDNINNTPFLFEGETPDTLPAVARVLTVDLAGEAVAYPFEVLQAQHVINDTVADTEIAVFWAPGTASALDTTEIAQGRDVGAANAFLRELDGQTLTFVLEDDQIVDEQTGSTWNVLGTAVSGELAGEQLEPVVAVNHFWFSWAAFKPETRVYQPEA